MKKLYVHTFGCKVNNFDAQAIIGEFTSNTNDYVLVEDMSLADMCIVNTCSVTLAAEKDARYLARKIKRINPSAFVVFTGCYAQINSMSLSEMNEIDFVVPNELKHDILNLVESRISGSIPSIKLVKDNKQDHFKSSLILFSNPYISKSRVPIKIQDGCNGFCAYCVIPYARGASRSVEANKVLTEVERLKDHGIKEIIITGIHVGDYGKDLNGECRSLTDILKLIIKMGSGIRIRLSSLEPNEISEDLITLITQNQDMFCDHFHFPLQSGSDEILKRMRRKYSTKDYLYAVNNIRSIFPNASIGADVIPGFPGETEEQFQDMYRFIEDFKPSYLHVFPYSKRPNTAALKMLGHIAPEIIKRRTINLINLSKKLENEYQKKFIGKSLSIIWENKKEGMYQGTSRNYLKIHSKNPDITPGSLSRSKIDCYNNKLNAISSN